MSNEFKEKDPLGIIGSVIFYNDGIDAIEISNSLMNLGYIFFEPYNIKHEVKHNNWNAFSPSWEKENEYDFIISNGRHEYYAKYPKISSEEIHKILGLNIKKYKKIEHPDDPYGEENWGYEVVQDAYGWEDDEFVNEPPVFEIGDIIEANGSIGMRTFRKEIGTVVKIQTGTVNRSDMYKGNFNNKKDSKYYSGTIYRIDFGNDDLYWISPWNMHLLGKSQPKEEQKSKIKWYSKGHLGNWEDANESMSKDEAFIGQRVKFVYNRNLSGDGGEPSLNGLEGTIISKYENLGDTFGIEFDEKIECGHDCSEEGKGGKDGYCYWVSVNFLEPIEENLPVRIRWYKKGHLSESLNDYELKVGDYVEVVDYMAEEFNGKVGIIIDVPGCTSDAYTVKFQYKFSGYQWNALDKKDKMGLSRMITAYFLRKSTKEKYDELEEKRILLNNQNRQKHFEIDPLGEEEWGDSD